LDPDQQRDLIDRYLNAYNTFDIEGMLSLLHADVEFTNVEGGVATAKTSGIDELRKLAAQSKAGFSSRRQTPTRFEADGDQAVIEVAFRGLLACDLPNGIKRGQVLELVGKSEFRFRDGRIHQITDIA